MRNRFLIFLLVLTNLATAQFNATEKRIITAVDKSNDEGIELLKTIVNINSGTMNFEGVKEVGKVLIDEFQGMGMQAEWVDGSDFGRAGHLVARQQGKGPTFLLIGHLDTVFELSSPFQEYKMLDNNVINGPGVSDMKGGDVVIVQVLKSLRDAGVLKKMNVVVIMTGDEELSGTPIELSKKDLVDAAKEADIALGFENGDGKLSTVNVSRRGYTGWQLTVEGTPAHSSRIFSPSVGSGAIFEASRILNQFYESLSKTEFLTFNPGMMLAGTSVDHDQKMDGGNAYGKSNVVAKYAVTTGDIRALTPEIHDKAMSTMRDAINENLPGTSAKLQFDISYPPFAPTEGNKMLMGYLSEVSKEMGVGEVSFVDPMDSGAADIAFAAPYVKMAIDGLGFGGGGDHTYDEFGNLDTLPIQTKRVAILMYRLFSGKYKLQ
ncbi:M20/M25/M40 family metallo-hydrolase [Flagellimonas nanhaiensis]|uniref:M20/M25/M40 family metallo-hydrolase n=1 Tax=Flagellimonas nanhaiensis TaxID=2292706 RepID=A0A371JUQ1_9FLAO|nr:M20/M25/M40 family metallo-hydrolase [Allomuricauda nanhaiensis]RDY61520.1 M20/M25/M40 family metallo-hydrolase [Allomuricauda nanhaiensis]